LTTDISLDEEITKYPPGSTLAVEHSRGDVSSQRRWLSWAIPLGVFLLALIPRLLGLNVFLTADEDDQLRFASGFLVAVLDGNWKQAVLLGYPGVPTMALGGLGLWLRYLLHQWGWAPLPGAGPDLASTLAHVTDYPLAYIRAARLPMVVAASLVILGIYLLLRRLVGRRIALVAALLIAFEPFLMANSRILHVDAPLAYFMFLSFLAFLLYLKEARWQWLIVSGLAGALATLSKTPGAILGPILVIAGLIYALHPADGTLMGSEDHDARPNGPGRVASARWRRFVIALVIWGLVAVLAFYALWPSMWVNPGRALRLLTDNVRIAVNTTHPSSGVFWGPTRSDQNPLYYLISIPFHLTPLTTIGLLAGIVATWRLRRYRVLLLALWAYAIIFIAPVSIVGRRGDRYALPVYLALDLLAAVALVWVVNGLASVRWTRLKRRWTWALGIAVGIQILFISLFHPYYFNYFNPLLGGGRTAPYLINVGWGEGLDRAAAYLNQLPDAPQKTIASWYSFQFAPFFRGRTADLSSNEPALTADYTVFYINQVQRGFPSQELILYFNDREPLHTIKLGGVDYASIYPGPVVSAEPPAEVKYPIGTVLGGALRLVGYDMPQESVRADAELPITLYWETLSPIRDDYNVYVRLVDEMGNVWGQIDRLPLGGMWRTNQWLPGAYVRDEYRLALRRGTPPGVYHLEVAMYSFATGETFGVARNIGQVEVTPAQRMTRPKEIVMQNTLRMSAAPGLELMGYDLGAEKVGPGERLPVTFYWRATGPIDVDYRVQLDGKSVAGNEGGGWSDRLASEEYPTSHWRRGEIMVDVHQLQMPPTARSGLYLLSMRLTDPNIDEYASDRVILGKLEFVERARRFDTPDVQYPVGVDLGSAVNLIGYDLPQESVAPGEAFPLTLYWRALDEMDTSYTVFVHVVGPDGVIRGQWDSVPGDGTLPTTGWVKDEVIADEYLVPMDEDLPPWQYTILVGMYDPTIDERLHIKSGDVKATDSIPLRSIGVEP
jgi:4-amino-4-deoxy-L-arabinose transferase-like glycosyltransferase